VADHNLPHGFLLLFASLRVALAAPDENARRFADRLLGLAGWGPKQTAVRARGTEPSTSSNTKDEGIVAHREWLLKVLAALPADNRAAVLQRLKPLATPAPMAGEAPARRRNAGPLLILLQSVG
jgi:hypothetical protein